MRKKLGHPLLVLVYLFGWCFTSGFFYNRHRDDAICNADTGVVGVAAGAFWPLYWVGYASIELTSWARPAKQAVEK